MLNRRSWLQAICSLLSLPLLGRKAKGSLNDQLHVPSVLTKMKRKHQEIQEDNRALLEKHNADLNFESIHVSPEVYDALKLYMLDKDYLHPEIDREPGAVEMYFRGIPIVRDEHEPHFVFWYNLTWCPREDLAAKMRESLKRTKFQPPASGRNDQYTIKVDPTKLKGFPGWGLELDDAAREAMRAIDSGPKDFSKKESRKYRQIISRTGTRVLRIGGKDYRIPSASMPLQEDLIQSGKMDELKAAGVFPEFGKDGETILSSDRQYQKMATVLGWRNGRDGYEPLGDTGKEGVEKRRRRKEELDRQVAEDMARSMAIANNMSQAEMRELERNFDRQAFAAMFADAMSEVDGDTGGY